MALTNLIRNVVVAGSLALPVYSCGDDVTNNTYAGSGSNGGTGGSGKKWIDTPNAEICAYFGKVCAPFREEASESEIYESCVRRGQPTDTCKECLDTLGPAPTCNDIYDRDRPINCRGPC